MTCHGAIEIHHVNQARPLMDQMSGSIQGAFVIDSFLVHIALVEANTTSVFDIDGGNN
jgi:hypothetical protein